MFTKFVKKFGFAFGCLLALLAIAALYTISWAIACGLIYLITLCFGWTFKWSIATGIWLIICAFNVLFTRNTSTKK